MHLREGWGDKAAGPYDRAQQTVVQFGLVHGLDLGPVQAPITGKFDVLGDYAFGDAKRAGNVLVGVVEYEFETQDVFDLTHSDPSDVGQVGSSKSW
jgi:hypothetical protein